MLRPNFNGAGWNAEVVVAFRSSGNLTGNRQTELATQRSSYLFVVNHHLADATGVTHVNESNSAVITPAGNPAGDRYGLPNVFFAQRTCDMRANHDLFSLMFG